MKQINNNADYNYAVLPETERGLLLVKWFMLLELCCFNTTTQMGCVPLVFGVLSIWVVYITNILTGEEKDMVRTEFILIKNLFLESARSK